MNLYEFTSDQDKKYHHVVGYGLEAQSSQIFGVHGELPKRGFAASDGSTDEVTKLRAQLATMMSIVDIQYRRMQKQSQELQGVRSDLQHLISLLRNGLGGIPDSSMFGTRADDKATNAIQALHLLVFFAFILQLKYCYT